MVPLLFLQTFAYETANVFYKNYTKMFRISAMGITLGTASAVEVLMII